jgi:hypothetical protein
MKRFIPLGTLICSIHFLQAAPPEKLCSKDNNYCVQISESALPDKSAKRRIAADYPESEDRTLVLLARGRTVAQYPTFGYLLKAFWSPDNRFVAINNRRANAGDYLWILSLSDSRAIKVPENLAPNPERRKLEVNYSDVVKQIARRFPKCTEDEVMKNWLEAQGWKTANELAVRESFRFFDGPQLMYVIVGETYRVFADKFERLTPLDIRRVRELTD